MKEGKEAEKRIYKGLNKKDLNSKNPVDALNNIFRIPVLKRGFWGLASFEILAMFRRGLFYVYLSIYMRFYLGLSVTITTLYATIPMLLNASFQTFIWGRVSDRFRKRRFFVMLGESIAGVFLFILYIIHSLILRTNKTYAGYELIIGLSIIEIFWSMSNVNWSSIISDLFPSYSRNKVMGNLSSLGGVGRIFGVFIGGFLYDLNGMKYAGWGFSEGALFYACVLIIFLSLLPLFMIPKDTIKVGKEILMESRNLSLNSEGLDLVGQHNLLADYSQDSNHKDINIPQNVSQLRVFQVFIISMFIINIGLNSIAVIYSQFLSLPDGFNLNSSMIGVISNFRSVSVIIFGFLVGPISRVWGAYKMMLFSVCLGILCTLMTGFSGYLWIIAILSFLFGVSDIIFGTSSYTIASILIPLEKRAQLFGLYNASFFVSWGLGTTLFIGPLIDYLLSRGYSEIFSYQMGFLAASIIALIGFSILFGLYIYLNLSRRKVEPKVRTSE
ncbi:MAG: MFS transporter [Promethearchaeota archaeon]